MSDNISVQIAFPINVYKLINKNAKQKRVKVDDFIKDIVENEVLEITLIKGFVYKKSEKKILTPDCKEIVFTKKEELVLELLLENLNSAVSIDCIVDTLWKGKQKDSSLFSLRNIIKSIRDKTDYHLINSVMKGYVIKTA